MKKKETEVDASGLRLEEARGTQKFLQKRPIRSTVDDYFRKKGVQPKYKSNSKFQKRFDLDVMTFLSNCNLPYALVETRGFKHFLSIVSPKYSLKSRHTMSRRISPLLYQNLYAAFEEVLKRELPHCRNVAFTSDEWTSRARHGYLCLTIHYINKDFQMRKFTVACRSTEGKSDEGGLAFNLRSMIMSIPGDNTCKLIYILTL